MNHSVTIVIPVYNGEKFLDQTIESCIRQTYYNVNIIVIDDCSSDRSIDVASKYSDHVEIIINETNLGIVKTINKAIGRVTTDYFLLLGHDDILPPHHIEVMIDEFKHNNNLVGVHCNSIIIDSANRELGLSKNDDLQIEKQVNNIFHLSLNNFINSCGMLHRTDIFNKIGGWDDKYKNYGEWLYYVKALDFGDIQYTTKTRSYYRKHETNITNSFEKPEIVKTLNGYKELCRSLAHKKNKNSPLQFFSYHINRFEIFLKGVLK